MELYQSQNFLLCRLRPPQGSPKNCFCNVQLETNLVAQLDVSVREQLLLHPGLFLTIVGFVVSLMDYECCYKA